MAVIARMQAVIPFASNLPTDVITNTLYFHDLTTNTDVEVVADAVNPFVQAFYDAIYAGTIPNYLANPGTWEARWYSVGTPPPNFPYILPLVATSKTTGPTDTPTEVATVLSFQGDPLSGSSQARRRGRIYIGAIHDSRIVGSTAGPPPTFPHFEPTWRTLISNAAAALMNNTPVPWVVYSPTNNATTTITNGWVDDTPDTQRRRGVEASARTLWS